jgi:hypothetical protein
MSRLDQARARAGAAKRALTAASAVGFVVALLLARAAHPGHAAHAQTSSATVTSSSSSATVVPQVTTHVS